MTIQAGPDALREVLARSYQAVNAQDLSGLRATLHADASWPDTLDGGRLEGREAIVAHYARMFAVLRPDIQLIRIVEETADSLEVEAQLLVQDPQGHIWSDTRARLIYRFRDGLICDVVILSGV